jgi:hypothetical protein
MVNGLERVGRDAKPHAARERIGLDRDIDQIGQEAPLGLAVGMADLVANQCFLAGQVALARHG